MTDLCRALQRRGHDVFIALRPTNEWQEHLDFLPDGRVLHVSVRNPFGVLSAKRLGSYARKHRIDVIHAHLPRDYFPGSLASTLAKNAKFVLTRHHAQLLKPFNRFALKNLSAGVAASKEIERSLSVVFPPHKLRTVANGVDMEFLAGLDKDALAKEFREFHGIADDAFVVGMIGELTGQGGQREFVLAAGEVAKQHPSSHFILIGTDPTATQTNRRELVRLTEVLGLAGKFLFLDHAGDSYGLFSATDVLLPSLDWEYPGRDVLEAVSLETAVLQLKGVNSKPFFDIEEILLEKAEALDIATLVGRLAGDRETLDGAVRRSIESVARSHSIDFTAGEIEKVYTKLK